MTTKLLRKPIQAIAFATFLGASGLSAAAELETQKNATLGGSILVGGLIGGPPGVIVGMMTGALIGEQMQAQSDLENAEQEVATTMREISQLESRIAQMQQESSRLQENLLSRLEFQMLFRTGDDQLTELDQQRIATLVNYLKRNPELHVRLDGHADQRGTDEYNNLLSLYRAKSVADALIESGIEKERIITRSHGASKAHSKNGDYEGYALDRRVNIEVFEPSEEKGLAKLN